MKDYFSNADYFWSWMATHWILGFFLLMTALLTGTAIVGRMLRLVMVCARGWPKNPAMDADGDLETTKNSTVRSYNPLQSARNAK